MPIIRDYSVQDGINVFDSSLDERSAYDADHLHLLNKAESFHFWFTSRKTKIADTFHKHVKKKARILEIGGGTGFVAEQLIRDGFSIEMGEIHLNGLRYAKEKGILKLHQFDLFNPPFQEEFDVICLFDVLEHLADDQSAIENIMGMLKPGGKIIFTVPAHCWLWCQDDVIAGHHRRYTKKRLQDLMQRTQLKVLLLEYFFIGILPLLVLRKWIRKKENSKGLEFHIPSFLNKTCRWITKLDSFFPNLAGGSLIGVVQKTH
jgi:2-polyprenyl-3-methyl-5-hydroxy-6-metoxy-1,4-benzoquinol methylase